MPVNQGGFSFPSQSSKSTIIDQSLKPGVFSFSNISKPTTFNFMEDFNGEPMDTSDSTTITNIQNLAPTSDGTAFNIGIAQKKTPIRKYKSKK